MPEYEEDDYDNDDDELEERQSEIIRKIRLARSFERLRSAIKHCEKITLTRVGNDLKFGIIQPDMSFGFEI